MVVFLDNFGLHKKFLLILILCFNRQAVAACRISPALKSDLIKLTAPALPGKSPTHIHTQKILKKDNYDQIDLTNYLKKIDGFRMFSDEATSEFSQLILKVIELEKELSPTHHIFYHGTRATTLILLNTMLEQARQKKDFHDLFLLRNQRVTSLLSGHESGYDYVVEKIKSVYVKNKRLGRFDNTNPLRTDLLSANQVLLARASDGSFEDSIRNLDGQSRILPAHVEDALEASLNYYGITDLPADLKRFLYSSIGSLLMICLPKDLSKLAYLSHPFGVPFGLPVAGLVDGMLSQAQMYDAIKQHKQLPLDTDCTDFSNFNFPQARLLLNPDYFANHASPIKMAMFLWQNQENMRKIQNNFEAIKAVFGQGDLAISEKSERVGI